MNDLDPIRERHHESKIRPGHCASWRCTATGGTWPCDTRVVLDSLDEIRETQFAAMQWVETREETQFAAMQWAWYRWEHRTRTQRLCDRLTGRRAPRQAVGDE